MGKSIPVTRVSDVLSLLLLLMLNTAVTAMGKRGLSYRTNMISSTVMIGKSSAESYLTFGSENELEGISVGKHICLLATLAPAFMFTAVVRACSFAPIAAWSMVP